MTLRQAQDMLRRVALATLTAFTVSAVELLVFMHRGLEAYIPG